MVPPGCLLGASRLFQMAPDVYTPWVLVGGGLDSGKWLDEVDETFLKHFVIVSNTLHPLYPDMHLYLDIG